MKKSIRSNVPERVVQSRPDDGGEEAKIERARTHTI